MADLKKEWDEAFEHPGEKIPVGRIEGLRTIWKHREERHIRALCGSESFADFVRRVRGPDAYIRVTVHEE